MKSFMVGLGFVVGYLLASFTAMLSIVGTQAMTGDESGIVLFLFYTGGWSVLYGLGGGIPTMISRDAKDSIAAGFVRFGAGGAVAGGLLATLIIIGFPLGGSPMAALGLLAFPFTVPWVFAALLSRIL